MEYKFVSETPESITIQHPNGRQATLGKTSLGETNLEEMRSFPKVEDQAKENIGKQDSWRNALGTAAISVLTGAPLFAAIPGAIAAGAFTPKPNFDNPETAQRLEQEKASLAPPTPVQPAPQMDTGIQNAAYTPEAQPVNQAQPNQPDAYGMQMDALKKSAEAQAKGELEKAALIDTYKQDLQTKVTDFYAKQRADLDVNQAKLEKEYTDGTIDPNHFWNKQTGLKGGFNRVLSMIGLFLGGNAQVRTGTNPAQQMLQQAINADIDAQKENVGKTRNLLSLNQQKYGNLQAAELATRSDLLTAFQSQLSSVAAKTNSEVIKRNADFQIGEIMKQKQMLNNQTAAIQTDHQLNQYLGSNIIPDAMVLALPEKQAELMVNVGPNQNVKAKSLDDAKAIKDSKPQIDHVISLIDQTFMDMGIDPSTGKPNPKLKDNIGTAIGGDLPLLGNLPGSGEKGRKLQAQLTSAVLAASKNPGMRLNEFTDENYVKRRVPNMAQYQRDEAIEDLMRLKKDFQDQVNQQYAARTFHNPNTITPSLGRAK